MSTQVTIEHNPAHPIGTCAKCQQEMNYNVPRLGPNGGYVHKGTGRVECGPTATGESYRLLDPDEPTIEGDEVRPADYKKYAMDWRIARNWRTNGGKQSDDHIYRRRIEQPATIDKDARILELETALRDLVKTNEEWNASVLETTGPRPLWNDSYLDAARKVLAKS